MSYQRMDNESSTGVQQFLTALMLPLEKSHPASTAAIKQTWKNHFAATPAWAPHTKDGFYGGPAIQHHQCVSIYHPAINKIVITDTVSWHPAKFKFYMPGSSREEILRTAIERATDTLSEPPGNFMIVRLNRELDIMQLLGIQHPEWPRTESVIKASYIPCP